MDDDNLLIKKYLNGDDLSLKYLIEKYTPSIFNFSRRFVKDDATDITQDIFIKVWKNIHKFNSDKSQFKTWLFTIARNTVIDHLRKKKAIPMSYIDEDNSIAENIPDENPIPSEILEKMQDKNMVNNLLDKIPENYRSVITLYYGEDMTFKEIGEVLGKPLNTVKSYHYRAILLLKDLVGSRAD